MCFTTIRKMKTIKVKCLDCDIEFKATDEHHHLDMCPKCTNAIDYETYLTRFIGNIEVINES